MAKRRASISDNKESGTNHLAIAVVEESGGHDDLGGQGGGFSAGSGLRFIAQGSAEQANNAFLNQHAAGKQAAFAAKSALAQAAAGVNIFTFMTEFYKLWLLLVKFNIKTSDAHHAFDVKCVAVTGRDFVTNHLMKNCFKIVGNKFSLSCFSYLHF